MNLIRDAKGRWVKGSEPWNKGIKGLHLSPETEFKKENMVSFKNGIQKAGRDCIYLWTGHNKRVRRPRKIYEDFYGKIPKGLVIYHKDRNKYNDDIINLEVITRAELLKRNRLNEKTKKES